MEPSAIVEKMFLNDKFSNWLGIEPINEGAGFCKLRMTIRDEMCNGFSIAHGGITYSFADSALAFASNSRGKHAVSIETSISHIKSLTTGEVIIATAVEVSLTNRIGIYNVTVEKESGELVALFKGTVYRKDKEWE